MVDKREIILVGCDAGGTMTDMLLVDKSGDFVLGKAATTPADESIGFWESLADACECWGIDWQREARSILPGVSAVIYCGTTMLNALLTRTGRKTGIILNKGFEDAFLHQRGFEPCAGYGYADKTHKLAQIPRQPFVPKKLIKGVTERIGCFGDVVVPLYEDEARKAVVDLMDKGVEGIVVLFIYSYLNPVHEKIVAEIAGQVMREKGRKVSLYLSSELDPISREHSRLNAMVLQAYGAEPARKHLLQTERKLKDNGYRYPLQVVLADGSLANIRYPALFKACFSGPIGGLLGGKYLSEALGMSNLVCTDMGGTSFDVGLIMGGEPQLLREVEVGQSILNIPTLVMDSIGAGCGQYVTIDPESKRIDIGPVSAGSEPGPVCYGLGNETPTVMDFCLILGILNPDYYLGGKLKLDKDLAYRTIKEKCADPYGIDPHRLAEGVVDLINTRMREYIKTVLSVRGYSPADYYVIGYGGAGPMFLAGYTAGLPFKGVFTVPWAAAFSAFGLTATDYVHRYQKSTSIVIPFGASDEHKESVGQIINANWEDFERIARNEMEEEGFRKADIQFRQVAYLRYMGQLEDLEVISPVSRVNTVGDMDKLIAVFEDLYSKKYIYAARYPEAGYQILELGLISSVSKPKPRLRKYLLSDKTPPEEAFKGQRQVYVGGDWKKASLYEMDLLQPGNEVYGLAIIEAPSTTMPIPLGKKVVVDEYKRYWLEEV
jgi:N-methylhydantoinase A